MPRNKPTPAIPIELPALLGWQQELLSHPARFKVVACGRQSGKTTLGKVWLTDGVLPLLREDGVTRGYPCAYMAPTFKMTDQTWREMKEILAPIIIEKDEQNRFLHVLGGGTLEFWTLSNPEGPRGRRYKRIVMDEAAFVAAEDVWYATIQPTTLALQGSVLFLSTPRGLNWFWKLWKIGENGFDPEWKSFRYPTTKNPLIRAKDIEAARRLLPEKVFAQEYEASFVSDAGAIFRNVALCATATPVTYGLPGHSYVIGADFAKSEDFSVYTVIDVKERALVHMERTQSLNWEFQTNQLLALCERFRPMAVVAEQNSMGDVIIDRLFSHGVPVQPFYTTGVSKAQLVQDMAFAFDAMTIKILDDPVLLEELMAFQGRFNPSGTISFAAPDGGHDDTVMSLMLAWHATVVQSTAEVGMWRMSV